MAHRARHRNLDLDAVMESYVVVGTAGYELEVVTSPIWSTLGLTV
jgi:hypothetical protein